VLRLRLLPAALGALAAAAPAASARPYDLRTELGPRLAKVADRTGVPVRVPARLALDFAGATYASGSGSRRSYELALAGAPDCGSATACFLASFTGERGGHPAFRRRIALARGITGYYKPLSCGASCSPPMLQWVQRGVLYGIQAKVEGDARAALVRAAGSAIRSRAR
jgi:hypothetical protein